MKSKIFKFIIVIFFQSLIFLYYLSRLLYGIGIKSKAFLIKDNANRLDSLQVEYKYFNETIRQKYISLQQFFCKNPYLFNNSYIESRIKSTRVNFSDIIFDMFVYEADDYVSEQISIKGKWESNETESFFLALLFYENKKNISKNDIYILDIGGNIGWYSLILGKKGYNILSFEPSKINYYILLKNYCLNKEINLTIINKGLDNIEKNGSLYHHLKNIGNALTSPNISVLNMNIKDYEIEEIKLCKLNDYIEFLKSQNVALIKLDIEGYEGKAIESGIDLIIKYHIPFIFMEWTPSLLRSKGTDPKAFFDLFENNGYKISTKNFLSKQYISAEQIVNEEQLNIYIIYNSFLH